MLFCQSLHIRIRMILLNNHSLVQFLLLLQTLKLCLQLWCQYMSLHLFKGAVQHAITWFLFFFHCYTVLSVSVLSQRERCSDTDKSVETISHTLRSMSLSGGVLPRQCYPFPSLSTFPLLWFLSLITSRQTRILNINKVFRQEVTPTVRQWHKQREWWLQEETGSVKPRVMLRPTSCGSEDCKSLALLAYSEEIDNHSSGKNIERQHLIH